MPAALHDAAMQRYRQYLVVGGMPECVFQFVETQDYILGPTHSGHDFSKLSQ